MNERPLRFGLAGTGYWARITHAPALASTAGIELAAVWGRNVEAAAALAGSYHCAWYDNFDDFLASVDAVAFAIPPDIQAMTRDALLVKLDRLHQEGKVQYSFRKLIEFSDDDLRNILTAALRPL